MSLSASSSADPWVLARPADNYSARIPIYTLIFSAFIPDKLVWGVGLQGLVMFGRSVCHSRAPFNDRQRDILNRPLDGFEGKLTTSKYAAIEKTLPDTALRDITDLIECGILTKDKGGGRSTSYSLAEK